MSEKDEGGDHISATIGDVSGGAQVGVGKNISQTQIHGAGAAALTEAEQATLRQLFADLKSQVEREAPPEKKGGALERVEELQEAVTAEKPDEGTIQYVKKWFLKHLPSVAGSVVSLVVHPIVGKLVEAGGDAAASAIRRHYGGEEKKESKQ